MEETDDAREDREWSDIKDSGLEPDEVLMVEGRLESMVLYSVAEGQASKTQWLKAAFCATAIAEHIDGRRDPQALTAGVLEATEDGVSCGVGSGPIRANRGVGGAISGFGSKNRGGIVEGVGVLSCDCDSSRFAILSVGRAGVGVVGDVL